jgi:hypothetical protein
MVNKKTFHNSCRSTHFKDYIITEFMIENIMGSVPFETLRSQSVLETETSGPEACFGFTQSTRTMMSHKK